MERRDGHTDATHYTTTHARASLQTSGACCRTEVQGQVQHVLNLTNADVPIVALERVRRVPLGRASRLGGPDIPVPVEAHLEVAGGHAFAERLDREPALLTETLKMRTPAG